MNYLSQATKFPYKVDIIIPFETLGNEDLENYGDWPLVVKFVSELTSFGSSNIFLPLYCFASLFSICDFPKMYTSRTQLVYKQMFNLVEPLQISGIRGKKD